MTVSEVLKACTVEGNVIKLPNFQLDRKLYMDVAKALNGIGGKWVGGKVYGFVFPSDPSELLQRIAGEEKINLKKDFQFFATPDNLADTIVKIADIEHQHRILEPSAGMGALVKAINRVLPDKVVDCYELMPTNIMILEKNPNVNLVGKDFLQENNGVLYDRIIANPPFSKNQDIDHIREMYKRLDDGGAIVTIASLHWQTSNNRKETEFREWLYKIDAYVRKVPAGMFKESGTVIETAIIFIRKPVEKTIEIPEKTEEKNQEIIKESNKPLMETIRINSEKVKNWNEIPVVWKNTKQISKVKYTNSPEDKTLLSIIEPFIGKDELKPPILGLNLDAKGFTGTDGNVLLHIPEPNKAFKSGIYPTAWVKKNISDIKDWQTEKYPDYVSIIPVSFLKKYKINSYKLLQYCKVAIKYSNSITFLVRFKVNDDEMIGLSGKFVIQIMEAFLKLGFEDVYLCFNASSQMVIFSNDMNPKVGKSYIALLMPIRISLNTTDVPANLGSMDLDYKRECSVYYDFSKDAIINADGSIAEFLMDYGEYTIFTKEEIALIKATIATIAIIPILEYFASDGTNVYATNLEISTLIKGKYLEKGLYRILDNAAEYQEAMIDEYLNGEFPKIPVMEKVNIKFIIQPEILTDAVTKLSDIVSRNELKPSLTGINLRKSGAETYLAATNGDILGKISASKVNTKTEQDFSVIIPAYRSPKTLPAFLKLCESPIVCQIDPKRIMLESAEGIYIALLVDERYPDIDSAIPKQQAHKLVMNREEVVNVLKRKETAEFVSKHKREKIVVTFSRKDDKTCDIDIKAGSDYQTLYTVIEEKHLQYVRAGVFSNDFVTNIANTILIASINEKTPKENTFVTLDYNYLMLLIGKISDEDFTLLYNDSNPFVNIESSTWDGGSKERKARVMKPKAMPVPEPTPEPKPVKTKSEVTKPIAITAPKPVSRTLVLTNAMINEIKESVKRGFDKVQVGMINKKDKGVMLINEKYQVRGTYPLVYLKAIKALVSECLSKKTEAASEQQSLIDAIAAMRTLADISEGKDKKEYIEAVEALETLIEIPFEKGGQINVSGFNLVYEKWSPIMGGNGISGTIRTIPENYYVATISEDGKISFSGIESMTRDIDKDKVKRLWNKGLIPDSKKFEKGGSVDWGDYKQDYAAHRVAYYISDSGYKGKSREQIRSIISDCQFDGKEVPEKRIDQVINKVVTIGGVVFNPEKQRFYPNSKYANIKKSAN